MSSIAHLSRTWTVSVDTGYSRSSQATRGRAGPGVAHLPRSWTDAVDTGNDCSSPSCSSSVTGDDDSRRSSCSSAEADSADGQVVSPTSNVRRCVDLSRGRHVKLTCRTIQHTIRYFGYNCFAGFDFQYCKAIFSRMNIKLII